MRGTSLACRASAEKNLGEDNTDDCTKIVQNNQFIIIHIVNPKVGVG